MSETDDEVEIEHAISVQPGKESLFVLLTSYPESDPISATGQVIRAEWDREGDYETDLATNDALANMWASPAGNLWVGSSEGNVWTTAKVDWPPPRVEGVEFDADDSVFDWKVTTLPDLQEQNYLPNITALWGTDDSDVFAATFEGAIYHWDGTEWREMPTGVTDCLNEIHGTGKHDVYCVGHDGVILHYDGTAWTQVPFSDDVSIEEIFTGVRALSPTDVYVCGRGGAVLHGSAGRGFDLLAQSDAKFYGLAHFQNRLILAAGEDGVWELVGNRPAAIKDDSPVVGVFEAGRLLFFVEPEQPTSRVLEYDPAGSPQWARREF